VSQAVARLENSSAPCLRVVQVTDTHLKSAVGGTLLGLDTDFSLQHVISLVQDSDTPIDLVLGTGDISDQGSAAAYRRAEIYFSQFGAPVLWLEGNHDCADTMAQVLGTDGQLVRMAESDSWQIVMLNSQIPGKVGGRLGAEELQRLEQCLDDAQRRSLHSLVCLHHQPVAMGSHWIDQQMIEDHEAFLQLIDRFSCVKGILWGHVHQQLDLERKTVKFMSSPSSCIQFAPACRDFKVDDIAPGYRWMDLYPDGRIESGVARVEGVKFEVDLYSDGYL
jgi:Icc protein